MSEAVFSPITGWVPEPKSVVAWLGWFDAWSWHHIRDLRQNIVRENHPTPRELVLDITTRGMAMLRKLLRDRDYEAFPKCPDLCNEVGYDDRIIGYCYELKRFGWKYRK